jgi:ERF superfamily
MPRSSESVAALASALAKAQAELVNPEKSLTATIRTGRAGEGGERSFRYAPLSSGLDIVRKTLGQHEIATMQTTALDPAAGLVNLTTMLAHASGEWIASDWPVCAIADLAYPQRMGAALTYARRYALFTLVGIAGEDDLDAPDLAAGAPSPSPSTVGPALNSKHTPFPLPPRPPNTGGNGHNRARPKREPAVILDPEQSATLREKLLAEICNITSTDGAATWAAAALNSKNRLAAPDSKLVEDAFEGKLSSFRSAEIAAVADEHLSARQIAGPQQDTPTNEISRPGRASGIDKSVLAIAEPRRYRNKGHLRFVSQQPCLVCGRKPSDPHHLRHIQPRGLGLKPSDEFTVPLCRVHHRAVHRVGDERAWWRAAGIEPAPVAQRLWQQTRGTEAPQPETVGGGEGKAAPSASAAAASAPAAGATAAVAATATPGP